MSINLRAACRQHINHFLKQYEELCRMRGHDTSARIYAAAADVLISRLPDKASGTPFRLTDTKISDCMDDLLDRFPRANPKSIALSLHRLILICKGHGLLDGRVMISRHARREELPIHDTKAIAMLDDFITFRDWLSRRIERTPRYKQDLPELVIASLIAVNGATLPSAHLKLTACRRSMLTRTGQGALLSVPTAHYSSQNPPGIQLPLLPEIERLMHHLKGSDDHIFPAGWVPRRKDVRKRNTRRINQWLHSQWTRLHGDHSPAPSIWNIQTFILCSRLFFALHAPPLVSAFLSGRASFGSYAEIASGFDTSGMDGVTSAREPTTATNAPIASKAEDLACAQELIEIIRDRLARYHHKLQSPGAKNRAAVEIMSVAIAYNGLLEKMPVLRELVRWICQELGNDGGKRKMGTFQAMWRFIPLPLVSELEHEDPSRLSQDQWYQLAEYLIQENQYASATRRKLKQHLKAFHEHLCSRYPHMERLNWRVGELQVQSEPTTSLFPTLSEFDTLFDAAGAVTEQGLAKQLQASLTLAFFGGLRAEEICLISKMDLDELSLQVRVWWSKTRKGRRRVPLGLLTPRQYLLPVIELQKQCITTDSLLFRMPDGDPVAPGTLGKRVKKLIENTLPSERATMTIHSLRHGFASWLLVRYMALCDPAMLGTEGENGAPLIPDADHKIFSRHELRKLVRVFNGRVAGERFQGDPDSFLPKPEHFRMISEMIGHATRDTTARTYIHSMPWIANHFISTLRRKNNPDGLT